MSTTRVVRHIALVLLTLASHAGAQDFRDLLIQAQKQYEQGRHEQALKLYRQADEAEPGHPAVAYNMGLCHLALDDVDKATVRFESVASETDVRASLRADAFYNIGLLRAESARRRLDELNAPASQPAEQVAPDDPANIETLQSIAAELLTAIDSFKRSLDAAPTPEAEHNIRAARILRRNVLGMLRRAMEQKEKDDILDDPQKYLQALIEEQYQLVGLVRTLVLSPPEQPADQRGARRTAVRLERKIMERSGTFADELGQFTESTEDQAPAPDPAATQPAEGTPRERIYHQVGAQMDKAVQSQRDACAFLLDGEVKEGHDKAFDALDGMQLASMMLRSLGSDPSEILVKARTQQAAIKTLVEAIEKPTGWLADPVVAGVALPDDAEWPVEQTAIFHRQVWAATLIQALRQQCEQLAALATRPAEEGGISEQQQQENPLLDPELNTKLAGKLAETDELIPELVDAIVARDRDATLDAQTRMLEIIDAALEMLPKSIEQRIRELIVRQARLNGEVEAETGGEAEDQPALTQIDHIRKLAARLKKSLFGDPPAEVAERFRDQQQTIHTDTVAVAEEVKQKIPPGQAPQPPPTASAPADDPASQAQAYIEAGKHLDNAGQAMTAAVEGFARAVIEDTLAPMEPDGSVPADQKTALEELIKALQALQPPDQQQQQNQQNQQQQQQQAQPDQRDLQRELERMERERERAMQELYQRRAREVIKDW